jgi:hypothetical protein
MVALHNGSMICGAALHSLFEKGDRLIIDY